MKTQAKGGSASSTELAIMVALLVIGLALVIQPFVIWVRVAGWLVTVIGAGAFGFGAGFMGGSNSIELEQLKEDNKTLRWQLEQERLVGRDAAGELNTNVRRNN